jgi:hypothetical protein
LEEQIRAPRIHREISKFIEDQEVQAPERRQARAQGVIDGGSDELVEELRDGPKQHALVRTARTDADGDRQVTFPGTGENNDRLHTFSPLSMARSATLGIRWPAKKWRSTDGIAAAPTSSS